MPPDPALIARHVSDETGLLFDGSQGRDQESHYWIELTPAGHRPADTFIIRTTIGWRSLDVRFALGRFAAELLAQISRPDDTGRTLFAAILEECASDGAAIDLRINGTAHGFAAPEIWTLDWDHIELHIRRGMLPINAGDSSEDERIVRRWTTRMAAAVLAIMPLEEVDPQFPEPYFEGLPEGAKLRIEVNRYERDRRNRAAALAIHGYACKACDIDMNASYGEAAVGLIEVHHVTPVSVLGPDYRINPATDLVPLCPNCHAVAHRRVPPYSVEEIRAML
jgi:5-methylcytosine-specific restriction enzyme A